MVTKLDYLKQIFGESCCEPDGTDGFVIVKNSLRIHINFELSDNAIYGEVMDEYKLGTRRFKGSLTSSQLVMNENVVSSWSDITKFLNVDSVTLSK